MKTVKQALQTNYKQYDKPLKLVEEQRANGNDPPARLASKGGSTLTNHPSDMMQERHRQIEEVAYYKAEERGFEPGHELEDWLAAEAEVDAASRPLESY